MHMHFCPPARSGVATRHRAQRTGRGITRLHKLCFWARKVGTPGRAAKLHPCAARGAESLVFLVSAKGIVTRMGRDACGSVSCFCE